MKLTFLACLVFMISCAHEKTPNYKDASYDTSGTIAVFYWSNPMSIVPKLSPAKRIVRHYFAQDGFDSVSMPGKFILKVKPVVDSVYMIATIDSQAVYTDSAGKQILDSATHKPQYLPTFRKPSFAPSQLIQETNKISFPKIK